MAAWTWRQHFAVNSDGTFLGCKHAIRSMKARRRGAIVNSASGLGVRAVLYLADPANTAVTGVALPVDAGQL